MAVVPGLPFVILRRLIVTVAAPDELEMVKMRKVPDPRVTVKVPEVERGPLIVSVILVTVERAD